jgi:hypothetical protein
MRKILIIIMAMIAITACKNNQEKKSEVDPAGNHKVIVQEVLNAQQYTYLKVKENETEAWLAVPAMEAKAGETYYYRGGFKMVNFESKDLKRKFDQVLFLEEVSKEPYKGITKAASDSMHKGMMSKSEKHDVKIDPIKGGIRIGELYKNKKTYEGKMVVVKGQVVKYTPGVMEKNWLHLQDGTEENGKFDLTVNSSDIDVKVGDVVTVEGKVVLDKNIGYGYNYEVLIEDAKLKK